MLGHANIPNKFGPRKFNLKTTTKSANWRIHKAASTVMKISSERIYKLLPHNSKNGSGSKGTGTPDYNPLKNTGL